jgi:hypothetical protein
MVSLSNQTRVIFSSCIFRLVLGIMNLTLMRVTRGNLGAPAVEMDVDSADDEGWYQEPGRRGSIAHIQLGITLRFRGQRSSGELAGNGESDCQGVCNGDARCFV